MFYQSFIYSPTDALVSCLQKSIKMYIKIYNKNSIKIYIKIYNKNSIKIYIKIYNRNSIKIYIKNLQ
jgi:LEA14-like dessication related protein